MNYGYTNAVGGDSSTTGYTPGRIDRSGWASKLVTFADCKSYVIWDTPIGYSSHWASEGSGGGINWVHNGGANFVFYDGHAEWAKKDKVTDNWFKIP